MSEFTWLLNEDSPFPDTASALGSDSGAPGLLAAGGELSLARLEAAYRRGIFPWFSPGQPVLWWSPDPRMVLPVAGFKLARSLRKTVQKFIRSPGCELRIDSAFDEVIAACASSPRDDQGGTWIVPGMIDAYRRWHRAGRVHSFETWIDGTLAGGLYGVWIGRMFFGESMFARRTDASKIALAALVCFCRTNAITLIDCQQNTAHLASFGAHELSRAEFEGHVARCVGDATALDWTYHRRTWAQLGFDVPDLAAPASRPEAHA